MTKNLKVLSLVCLILLSGCQFESETKPSSPSAKATVAHLGTGDSGGGNSYQGKPLESYLQDPQALPAFQKIIKPILDAAILDVRHPMRYVLEVKGWYFLPGPLENLPPETIGSAVLTDQAALQDFNQIWIDQKLFDQMSEADQAKLLLHEVLMGIKLLRWDSLRAGCEAIWYSAESGRAAEECKTLSTEPLGKASNLSQKDYADIRKTVAFLIQHFSELKQALDWRDIFYKGSFHFYDMYYVGKEQFKSTTYREIFDRLKQSLAIGFQPQYGYSLEDLKQQLPKTWKPGDPVPEGTVWKSTRPCKVELVETTGLKTLVIQIGDYRAEQTLREDSENGSISTWDAQYRFENWKDGKTYESAEIGKYIANQGSSNIYRADRLKVQFDYHLERVIVEEEYNFPGGNGSAIYELNGHYYACSRQPEMVFQNQTPGGLPNVW